MHKGSRLQRPSATKTKGNKRFILLNIIFVKYNLERLTEWIGNKTARNIGLPKIINDKIEK